MKRYVLGFAFDQGGTSARVALIRKDHPEWQKGRWNGIGGKVEINEPADVAMEREFREETGVTIPATDWRWVGELCSNPAAPDPWVVSVFTVTDKRVLDVNTVEKEQVKLWFVGAFNYPGNRERAMNNVFALLELCRIQPEVHGTPLFKLHY